MKSVSLRPVFGLIVVGIFSAFAYQNCANQASFTASDDLASILESQTPYVPNYASATAGDADSFPPLKLVFVVDNSGTMQINQVNLSKAFDRMFAGANVNNLAPFDTSAFLISTAQYTPGKGESAYSRVPSQAAELFSQLDQTQMAVHRGAALSGQIPGDLAGFGLKTESTSDRTINSFYPAPVALFPSNATSYTAHKPRNASVADFSRDFNERLALLNPTLSAVDPVTKRGVMDDIIDKESGLCALARVLKNNKGLLNPGDLTSIIVVSDENDQDPSGRACVESYIDAKGNVDYVDGRCEMPQTTLSYRAEITNPTFAKCRVDFQKGFSYKIDYKLPTTNVSYQTKSMKYDQLQTNVGYWKSEQRYEQRKTSVAYYTSKMTYDAVETNVAYYTKSPTYEIPQTSVKYFTEVEDCVIRDGAKTNCKYTYPSSTAVLTGDFGANCDAFVAGKLPSGALYNNASYKPVCSLTTPIAKSGACDPNDTSIRNCNQNYSAPKTVKLSGAVTSTCDAFVAGRLPSGGLYNDAGYKPSCGTIVLTAKTGTCSVNDTDKQNCQTVYTAAATPAVLNGTPGAKSCSDFAAGKLPSGAVYSVSGYLPTCTETASVTVAGACTGPDNDNIKNCRTVYLGPYTATLKGRPDGTGCENTFKSKLPAGSVVGNSTYPITCADGPTLANQTGSCLTTDPNVANCQTVYSSLLTKNLEGAPAGGNCAGFVLNRLGSGAVYTDPGHEPTCASGNDLDRSVSGDQSYASWPTFNPAVGDNCSDAVRNSLVTSRALNVSAGTTPVCKVTALLNDTTTLSDATKDLGCSVAAWQNVCDSSGGAKRGCMPTDIAAGAKYESNTTVKTLEGSFTCDTPCAQTNFCKTSSGTVGDNHYACSTTPAANVVKSTFVLEPESNKMTCGTGQTRVVTRGPYRSNESATTYVAGSRSEMNESGALVNYIVDRSRELFNAASPIVSVFVRQSGDPLGINGSIGTNYNQLADMLGGKKRSVLSSSADYASALEDLSAEIRVRLNRSVNFKGVQSDQKIRRVWFRAKGATDWGAPVDKVWWSASGGTITIDANFKFSYGDEFKIEYW